MLVTTYAITLFVDTVNLVRFHGTLGPYLAPSYFAVFTCVTALTDYKKRSALTLQNQQLQRDLRHAQDLSNLATQVSHDIRSPVGALGVVASRAKGLTDEEKMIVRTATERIAQIANDLLKKYRATKSVSQNNPSTLLVRLVEAIIAETKARSTSGNIAFNLHAHPSEHAVAISVDAGQFSRVLSNLINNGIEAIEATGSITIRVTKHHPNLIRLTIEDSGKGIPPHVLPNLMQKGFSYGKANGNGLGLYSAKEYLESLGGSIEIESSVGVGTKVYLTLPIVAVG